MESIDGEPPSLSLHSVRLDPWQIGIVQLEMSDGELPPESERGLLFVIGLGVVGVIAVCVIAPLGKRVSTWLSG